MSIKRMQSDRPIRYANGSATDARRVCRAWHKTREVKVLLPGVRRAEGQEKGKVIIAR